MSRTRAQHLLELLNGQNLGQDRWRMRRGRIVRGRLEDFVHSVDAVKQLETWIAAEEIRKFGYSEFFLKVSFVPPHWDAEVVDVHGREIACSDGDSNSEAVARLEAILAYVKATGLGGNR